MEDAYRLAPVAVPKLDDPLLLPRILQTGRATCDFKEELALKDGQIAASDTGSAGLIRDLEVAYFSPGTNRWRVSKMKLETVYKAQIKRKP